jgi:hypothetical protein
LSDPDWTGNAPSRIEFLSPAEPAPLTPGAARALLKVLLKARDAQERERTTTT